MALHPPFVAMVKVRVLIFCSHCCLKKRKKDEKVDVEAYMDFSFFLKYPCWTLDTRHSDKGMILVHSNLDQIF